MRMQVPSVQMSMESDLMMLYVYRRRLSHMCAD